MVVPLGPRFRLVAVPHCGRGRDLMQAAVCLLVLDAVRSLHRLQAHTRRGNGAEDQHQESDDPGWPRSVQAKHHDRTIGALQDGRNCVRTLARGRNGR